MTLEADGLFAGLPSIAPWYCSHYDQVVDVPAAARVTSRSARCGVHGFALVDRPVWGVQFHPEYFGLHGALLLLAMRLIDRSLDITEKRRVPATEALARAQRLFANFWRLTS